MDCILCAAQVQHWQCWRQQSEELTLGIVKKDAALI